MISMDDFEKVDMRIGTVLEAAVNEKAKKPAYRLSIDFGGGLGVKTSSAQLTALYSAEQLVGRLAQLAGLQPGPEPVRAADLVSRFSWERVPRGEIVIPANFSDGFRVFP